MCMSLLEISRHMSKDLKEVRKSKSGSQKILKSIKQLLIEYSYVILTAALYGRYFYCSHFPGKRIEAQKM